MNTMRELKEELKMTSSGRKFLKETEPCEDVVGRQAVLKEIHKLWNSKGDKDYCMETLRDFVTELPPVASTRKKGKWEQYGDFRKEKYRCSECKEEQPKILCGEQIIRLWSNYCPHCGAKMQEVEE